MSSNTPDSEGPGRPAQLASAPPVRWSRVILLVAAVLATGEGLARGAVRWRWGRPFASLDVHRFSGYGVYRENPAYTHPQYIHNSAGFRNLREFSITKPPRTFRVLAVGASVLYSASAMTHEGWSRRVPTDQTITAHLEPLLRAMPELAGYESVEVINAGVNRQFLRQTLSYYAAELARYDPDLVLVFGTNNDSIHLEWSGGESKLFYTPGDPTEEERRIELLANGGSLDAIAEKAVRVTVNHSALAAGAYRVLIRIMNDEIAPRVSAARAAEGAVPAARPQLASQAELDKNIRYYLGGLGALLTFIRDQGAQPVVFWEYNLLQVEGIKPYGPHERGVAGFLKSSGAALSVEQRRIKYEVRDRVAAYLRGRDVPMIDILNDLRSRGEDVYNDYLHYTPAGNRWVAGLIARDLAPIIRRMRDAPR